jgi:aldose 1-epimerase
MTLEKEQFGTTQGGEDVHRFVLENSRGLRVALIEYGATLQSVQLPIGNDRREIVLGFDSLESYEGKHPYFGSTVGRFCNRISGAAFELDGKEYTLNANEGKNHLHGGRVGFNRRVWKAEATGSDEEASVRFTLVSEDGEEGYPGRLDVTVTVTLTEQDELRLDYRAETNGATPINLTNHAYWNLRGETAGDVMDHLVQIEADWYLPETEELVPNGNVVPVADTPFDFRSTTEVGTQIRRTENGIDNCYLVRDAVTVDDGTNPPTVSGTEPRLRRAASLSLPDGEASMEIETTSPGIQFYTGNKLRGERGRDGTELGKHAALCLETQLLPDAINKPNFPSCVLRPGESFVHTTVHRFRY